MAKVPPETKSMQLQDDILEYYRRELSYLRVQGQDFAFRHPKVAQRLALTGGESSDPHTERLIEAVAFLSARVHRDLDREFPQVAEALLENLCPSLTQPVPSMTVVHMTLDAAQGKVTAGVPIAKGAMVQATGSDGQPCRFQVSWDTVLWPLQTKKIKLEDSRTLLLEISGEAGLDLAELDIDQLRFHLGGELMTTMPLHELLISGLERVELVADSGKTLHRLGANSLHECGFDEGHEVIPRPGHAHPAYGLLQEYFVFPRKFQFFDLRGLRGKLGRGSSFSLRLVFDRSARVLSSVTADSFKLGCVPIINLFALTSEPIVVDRRQHEYMLVGDRQREAGTEIHSVRAVIQSDPEAQKPKYIPSVYTTSEADDAESVLFWSCRREMSLRKDILGTDSFLSFVDRTNVRQTPAEPVVFAELWCTNRRVAEQMPPGVRMLGVAIPSSLQIRTLYEPTAQRDPVMSSQALWALVSLLRLNHRSLVDGTTGVQTLKDILMLFAGDSARDQTQVRGIKRLQASAATAQLGGPTWRGLCRGTAVSLEFDLDAFAGNSPLVLAGVLARFFALYTTVNSFVRVKVERNGELWKQWPALSGRQSLL
jgi:type VI secretion system protein ImpG